MMRAIPTATILCAVFIVMIILVFPNASLGDPRAQTIQFMCSNVLEHNTTIFVPNLVATFENISEQMRNSGFGVAVSGNGTDNNYGLAQCYGDLSLLDCLLCYAEVRTLLPLCFPYNGGRIFLDGCFMRTENYSFFQEFKGPQDRAVCGNQTTEDSEFHQLARQAILHASADALRNNGTARAELQDSDHAKLSVYVLAECWRVLNANNCKACLADASSSILGCLPSTEGRALNSGCFIRYSDTNFLNPIPATRLSRATSRFPMAKDGCKVTCGNNVTIPYPFGIGSDCSLSDSYNISCKRKTVTLFQDDLLTPFLTINGNDYELLEVSLRDQTVTITAPPGNISSCNANSTADRPDALSSQTVLLDVLSRGGFGTYGSSNLDATPFFYSKEYNRLTLVGCGNALIYQNHVVGRNKVLSGCTSTCFLPSSDTSSCYGINCCQTDIPFNLKEYWVNFTATETSKSNNSSRCTAAVLVDRKWKPEDNLFLPVVWSWTIQDTNVTDAVIGCNRKTSILEIESGNVNNYGCECRTLGSLTWFYEINPYLNGACDHAISVINKTRRNTKVAIIGATASFGSLFLMIVVFGLYKMMKKWHKKKQKEKYFKRNGGLLLQQHLSSNEGLIIEKTKNFSAKELKKACDDFNKNRVLGEGGQGTVYKGMLTDGRIVAVKISKKVGENQLEQFINEVVILSQINHRNVVKLLGCCLETEMPLLVYEFIPNGTLFNLIHNDNDQELPLTWSIRLRIATEVARALAYLHSSTSIPILHKDIKSSNILLDEKHTAIVSDFGTSRSIPIDKTHLTTRVQGTFGYIDPEYFQSSQFTNKSDVYSFGVVLIELLTRQKPISVRQGEDSADLGLASRFLESMAKGSLNNILDPQLVEENDEGAVIAVAKLAGRCVNLNGRRRPTMREVATELENNKMSKLDSNLTQDSPMNQSYVEEKFNDTWTFESDGIGSSLHSLPLLSHTI